MKLSKIVGFVFILGQFQSVLGTMTSERDEAIYNSNIIKRMGLLLQTNRENFLIFFYSINPYLFFQSEILQSSTGQMVSDGTQLPTFESTNTFPQRIVDIPNILVLKFSAPIRLALVSLEFRSENEYYFTINLLFPVAERSLGLLVFIGAAESTTLINDENKKHLFTLAFAVPAPIAILKIGIENASTSKLSLICSDYCSENLRAISSLENLIFRPQQLHRIHFWNGNGQNMRALGLNLEDLFFQRFTEKERMQCPTWLTKRSKLSYYCTSELMTTITLRNHHNISFRILGYHEGTDNYYVDDISQVFRSQEITPFNTEEFLSALDVSRFVFFSQTTDQVLYCTKTSVKEVSILDPSIWILPFPLQIWLLVGTIVFGTALLHSCKSPLTCIYFEIFVSLSIFIGESPPASVSNRRMASITLSVCGMFLLGLYGNDILSLVVTEEPELAFDSLKAFVEAGFKIIWPSNSTPGHYFMDFASAGIGEKFNESFHLLPGNHWNWETWDAETVRRMKIFNGTVKYGSIILGKDIRRKQRWIQQQVGEGSWNVKCYFVPPPLHPHTNVWEVRTMNMRWIMESLQRLENSGLSAKWDEWADRVASLNLKLNPDISKVSKKIELVANGITFVNLSIVFVCFFGVLVLASLFLIIEAFMGRKLVQ
ncbi:unnamed protein product [Orchesella dallaii]|uniref:Uncharacterized protein n=1 Tax=Orchesella dallaii TaxID=48710 RepID=A0ABP1PT63_9HEXA